MKSAVEIYWEKIAEKYGDVRKWEDLSPNAQQAVLHSVNLLFAVLHGNIQ